MVALFVHRPPAVGPGRGQPPRLPGGVPRGPRRRHRRAPRRALRGSRAGRGAGRRRGGGRPGVRHRRPRPVRHRPRRRGGPRPERRRAGPRRGRIGLRRRPRRRAQRLGDPYKVFTPFSKAWRGPGLGCTAASRPARCGGRRDCPPTGCPRWTARSPTSRAGGGGRQAGGPPLPRRRPRRLRRAARRPGPRCHHAPVALPQVGLPPPSAAPGQARSERRPHRSSAPSCAGASSTPTCSSTAPTPPGVPSNPGWRRWRSTPGRRADERVRRVVPGPDRLPDRRRRDAPAAAEGWMHNRVRMIDGQLPGEGPPPRPGPGAPAGSCDHLVDGDLASNQHGWQWAAGTGTDAAPFFRVFNPVAQGRALRPRRRLRPALGARAGRGARARRARAVAATAAGRPPGYPAPIVDHAEEREEALRRYAAVRRAAPEPDPTAGPWHSVASSASRTGCPIPCSTNARPPSSGPSWRSTSTPPSRWGPATSSARPACRCRRPPSATTWPPSSRRASCPAPHQRRARSPPTRATASSSTPSARPAPLDPTPAQQVRAFFDQAHGELEQMLAGHHAACCPTSPTTPRWWSARPHEGARSGRCSSSASAPGSALRRGRAVQRRGREAHHRAGAEDARGRPVADGVGATWPPTCVGHAAAPTLGPRAAPPATPPPTRVLRAGSPPLRATDAATTPTRSSSAARPRMAGAFDAVETVREVLAILEQQFVVVTLLRDVLDRGLHGGHRHRDGLEPLAECSLVVAPYEVEGEPAGTIGVLGPDPHELPAGPGRGGRRQPAPRPPPERGLTAMATDYYELLGVGRERQRRRDQAGLPPAGPRAAPRRQPATRPPRSASRRSPRPTRC